jgi:hypothetical protein
MRGIIRDDGLNQLQNRSHTRVNHPVDDRPALALGCDVSAPFETRKMIADTALRHRQVTDDSAHASWLIEQQSKNAQSGWIA